MSRLNTVADARLTVGGRLRDASKLVIVISSAWPEATSPVRSMTRDMPLKAVVAAVDAGK